MKEKGNDKKNNGHWNVKTNKGTEFSTPNVIIAGGVGSILNLENSHLKIVIF